MEKPVRISWFVLPNDKLFFQDLAVKEGKKKWTIFNEARIALEEKRAREARILENANEQRETGIIADSISDKIYKQNNGNGERETSQHRPGIFRWRRAKVQRSDVGNVQDVEL